MEFDLDATRSVLARTPPTLDAWLRDRPARWIHQDEGPDTWSPFDVVGPLAGLPPYHPIKTASQPVSGWSRPLCFSSDTPCETGDHYEWRGIHGFPMKGTVRESSAAAIAFGFGGNHEVRVSADVHGSGALLHLHQRGMTAEPRDRVDGSLNCRSCWIYFLTALKAQLEHDIDLRDHDPATADALSVRYNE